MTPDASLQRFERLRAYVRAGRAPWQREEGRLTFLTCRNDGAANDKGPDICLAPGDFAGALRARFTDDLMTEATAGLATRSPESSARTVISPQQRATGVLALLVAVGLFIAAPLAAAGVMVAGIAALFSLMIVTRLLLAAISAWAPRADAPVTLPMAALPAVTILVPLFREADALAGLAAALSRLDYPPEKLDIKLLFEERDGETIAEAHRLQLDRCFDFVIVPQGAPQTKPKACNYALPTARGDLLVIYDAEDEPEPAQLRLAAETFANASDDLACVQARLNFYNADENWLTRLFTLEYCLWFDHLLPALDRLGAPVPLGGTSNIFRTDALIEVGGWDPHNVTEDADLGLRLARRGYRTAVIDATTYEEANCRLPNWLRQRSRWMKGFMQTWLVHRRGGAASNWRAVLSIDLFVGGTVIAALVNPLLWVASAAQWTTGASAEVFLPGPAGVIAAASLAAGNLALILLAAAAPLRRGLGRLSPYSLLMPIYWLMMSAAAYVALFQLVTRPHYWEKTEHGLSKGARERRRSALRSLGFD